MIDFMDVLYRGGDRRDVELFGSHYCGPDKFERGKEVLVAKYPKQEGSDGQPCEIYETRMPARFFRLVALPSQTSLNKPVAGFTLATGSGDRVGRLIVEMVKEITQGMITCQGSTLTTDV